MGFIREPKGIDFVINSGVLTEKDKIEISNFIKEYKTKTSLQRHRKKVSTSKVKSLTT